MKPILLPPNQFHRFYKGGARIDALRGEPDGEDDPRQASPSHRQPRHARDEHTDPRRQHEQNAVLPAANQ